MWQLWRARVWPCTDLPQETNVVSARPVLDDHAIDNPPDVHVGPRDRNTRGLGTRKQSHGRGSVAAVDRHVVDDEVALCDEVMVIDGDVFTEIIDEGCEDLFPTLSALRTSQIVCTSSRVVHQVLGDKFVDDGVIARLHSTKQLLDDFLRFPALHARMMPDRERLRRGLRAGFRRDSAADLCATSARQSATRSTNRWHADWSAKLEVLCRDASA